MALITLPLFGMLVLSFGVLSIDLESAKEKPCFKPDKSQIAPVDLNWVTNEDGVVLDILEPVQTCCCFNFLVLSLNTVYFPLMSRFDLYMGSADQTGLDPKNLTENTVYYSGCITWTLQPGAGTLLQSGFGIIDKKYFIQPLDPDNTAAVLSSPEGGFNATTYTTLTDNQTFFVALNCYPDWDQMTWSVASVTEKLSKETTQLIHNHVESWDFKREQFTGLRYETCKDLQDGDSNGPPGHGWSTRAE